MQKDEGRKESQKDEGRMQKYEAVFLLHSDF